MYMKLLDFVRACVCIIALCTRARLLFTLGAQTRNKIESTRRG